MMLCIMVRKSFPIFQIVLTIPTCKSNYQPAHAHDSHTQINLSFVQCLFYLILNFDSFPSPANHAFSFKTIRHKFAIFNIQTATLLSLHISLHLLALLFSFNATFVLRRFQLRNVREMGAQKI